MDALLHDLVAKKKELLETLLVQSNRFALAQDETSLELALEARKGILDDLIRNDGCIETREKQLGRLAKEQETGLYSQIEYLLTTLTESNRQSMEKIGQEKGQLEAERNRLHHESKASNYLTGNPRIKHKPAKAASFGFLKAGLYPKGSHEDAATLKPKRAAL